MHNGNCMVCVYYSGLGIVGTSSVLASSDSGVDSTAGEMLFGFAMLGIGLLCNSTQLIVEECRPTHVQLSIGLTVIPITCCAAPMGIS